MIEKALYGEWKTFFESARRGVSFPAQLIHRLSFASLGTLFAKT